MAVAEARAAWHRTANRCLVQEDAKLAFCTSMPPSVKPADTPKNSAGAQDTPITGSLPFNRAPSCSNLSRNSKGWLQMQPNYGYQKVLIDQQVNSSEDNMEILQGSKSSGVLGNSEFSPSGKYATCDEKKVGNMEEELRVCCTENRKEFLKLEVNIEHVGEMREEVLVGYDVSKNVNHEFYSDSGSSWQGAKNDINTPWWRTADTEELAFFVAQRSLDLVENCDLPMPLKNCVKKDLNFNICCFDHDEICDSLLDPKRVGGSHDISTRVHTPGRVSVGSACPKHRMSSVDQLESGTDKQLSPTNLRMFETHTFERDTSNAQLLEALRHSQTRARESEILAQAAFAEKEHVTKLVFKQASQLFAYKQWLQLLQLENTYIQFINNTNRSVSTVVPIMLPWTLQKSRKTRRTRSKPFSRKLAKKYRARYDISKYAVVFALGLGLVGAGLLLGWTVGWMLPIL